jgi:hypothetical protein
MANKCEMCSNNFGKSLGNHMCWAITCFVGPKLALIGLGLGYSLGFKVSKLKILKTKKHLWVIPLRMSHLQFIGPIKLLNNIGNTLRSFIKSFQWIYLPHGWKHFRLT